MDKLQNRHLFKQFKTFVSKGKKNLNINKLYNSYHSLSVERKKKGEEDQGQQR